MTLPIDPASLPLRDIHLPQAVSWWPLAPAWWLLFLSLLLIIVGIFYLIRCRRRRRLSAMFQAQSRLEEIKNQYRADGDQKAMLKACSELLRRIAISAYPRHETASLTGEVWLQFLDRYVGNHEFQQGAGRVLIEDPYRQSIDIDGDKILQLVAVAAERINQRKELASP